VCRHPKRAGPRELDPRKFEPQSEREILPRGQERRDRVQPRRTSFHQLPQDQGPPRGAFLGISGPDDCQCGRKQTLRALLHVNVVSGVWRCIPSRECGVVGVHARFFSRQAHIGLAS
jgi:hypothetical protein